MFNSMKEVHAAIRTMSADELSQAALLTGKMFEQGSITQDQALEIMGIIIAHSIERSLKAQA
jgi:hypothetical protein